MEIILVRHGQSESNARLTTALDANLTELGRLQAEATAEYLLNRPILGAPPNVVILVSPFRRTLQTCRPLAERIHLPAHAYPDMCEYFSHRNEAYQSFEGMSEEEIVTQHPFVVLDSLFSCQNEWWPSSPEDLHAIYRRAIRVRDSLYARFGGSEKQLVIFSHAEPIGRLIEAMLHDEPADDPPWSENCGITRLAGGSAANPAELIVLNDTSHLIERGIVSPAQPELDAGFTTKPA